MRVVLCVFPLSCLTLAACASRDGSTADPASMRERLATQTHLFVTADGGAGAITAQRRSDTGWNEQLVELKLDSGELVVGPRRGDQLTVTSLELAFQTIAIPATVTGHAAELTRPHLHLIAPAEATAAWSDDDTAEATLQLAFALSWSLTIDGTSLPIGAPDLAPLPVKLQLFGDGARITAELRAHAAGDLWSWADLVKLSDLELVLGADTPM